MEELYISQTQHKKLFDCSLKIKRLLFPFDRPVNAAPPSLDGHGVKLPKLDVPKFDGNIVNWKTFWEQFKVSIHSRSSLSDAKKLVLVYLQHLLKDGTAKSVIKDVS